MEPCCPAVVAYRGRCQRHAREREQQTNRAGRKTYSRKRWKLTRSYYLFNHPLCECDDPTCFEIATDVHHRIDLADGGAPYDQANLQALAAACHSKLTRANQQKATP